ncbi:MAG: helix-turn-helix domain-containing protein [Vicinamibacterales bacterium]
MLLLTRVPAPPLDRAIAALWYFRRAPQPFALERVLPTGTTQLIVNLKEDVTRGYDLCGRVTTRSGSVLVGARTRFEIIDSDEQEHVIAAIFRPGGTRPFFAPPADAFTGDDVPLDALWTPAAAARLREQLLAAATPDGALDALERALRDAWRDRPTPPSVAAALATFTRAPHVARIGAVADAVGLSRKRFIEGFRREVGLTPKHYCRIRRFQRALTEAHAAADVDWAQVAAAGGYYDQSHFIHDFRSFSGLTPTGYRAGRTAFQNHVTFLQAPAG